MSACATAARSKSRRPSLRTTIQWWASTTLITRESITGARARGRGTDEGREEGETFGWDFVWRAASFEDDAVMIGDGRFWARLVRRAVRCSPEAGGVTKAIVCLLGGEEAEGMTLKLRWTGERDINPDWQE